MKFFSFIKKNYIIIGILLLGAILRFYKLDFQSVWLDEIHTMNEANPKFSFSEVYKTVMEREQMPPLYFYSVNILFKILGYSPFVVRLYSAIIGLISIYGIYLLGKELFSRRTGIIGAALISVNYLHLHFSQEARPYIFLLLFSTFSFYYLTRYLKNPTIKNILLHGLFAGLMISMHFFGLFVLFAQYCILLFFFILHQDKKTFFKHAAISGLVTLIIFIPSFKVFKIVSGIKQFWIPAPSLDVYTNYFNYFFGNSELVLAMVGFLIILYFVRLSKEKDTSVTFEGIVKNKIIFSFVVLSVWVVITMLIPLIRSYLSIPMLQPRYFVAVLPAIIIIISVGLSQFKNKIIITGLAAFFIVFSLIDIIVVKKYYNQPYKDQFREVSQFLIKNNTNNEPVATSWEWHFAYFLKNDEVNMNLVGKNLESYVNEIMQNPSMIKPFWYTEAHQSKPFDYTLSPAAQKFLDDNFIEENTIRLYDAWAKHFVPIIPTSVGISEYSPLLEKNGDLINFNVENFTVDSNQIIISGWAYLVDNVSTQSIIEILLINNDNGETTKIATKRIKRDDVTDYFKSNIDLSNSGFSSKINLGTVEKGSYKLGIIVDNKKLGKKGLVLTDKFFTK